MHQSEERSALRLRRRAETLMRRGASRFELEPVLEDLALCAEAGSEHAVFAHRSLAEVKVEADPWGAALHLRKLLKWVNDDDVLFALMGLAQALLGNYASSIKSYRRALQYAPRNPWYHHNLGHLLDVALGDPQTAARHLASAHRIEPLEHEITASYAQCLARLGRLDEALELAEEAVHAAPAHVEHRALLNWIRTGASPEDAPYSGYAGALSGSNAPSRPAPDADALDDAAVNSLLADDEETTSSRGERRLSSVPPPEPTSGLRGPLVDHGVHALLSLLRSAGRDEAELRCAERLWCDFLEVEVSMGRRVAKPEVLAAALDFAVAHVRGEEGVTQTGTARRYAVGRKSVAQRFTQLRDALSLEPFDPRYRA